MKIAIVLAGIGALTLPLLSGCANPSRGSEASELQERLSELSGVVAAELDYTEPQTLDSGKLALQVEMAGGVGAAEISDVVRTAYAAFADAHQDEEGDLDVTVGDDVVHLRSFEPEAEPDDVAQAAERAVAVLAEGVVRVDINTQDVADAPHVESRYDVTVAEPGAESLLAAVATLERQYADIPDAAWTVRAGHESGWALQSGRGFPDEQQRALLEQLGEGLPEGATMWLGDDASATLRLPTGTTPAEVSATVGRHLRLLGDRDELFYDVEQGGELVASLIAGDCTFGTDAVGTLLERDHGGPCAKITHA